MQFSLKDACFQSLTDRLLRMKAWDSDLEEEEAEKGGEKETSNGTAQRGKETGKGDKVDTQRHLQKVQKLIYAAKVPVFEVLVRLMLRLGAQRKTKFSFFAFSAECRPQSCR